MASSVFLRGSHEFHDAIDADLVSILEASRHIVEKGALIVAGRARDVFKPRPGGQRTSQKTGHTYYSFQPPYQATPPDPTSRSGKLQRSVGSYYRVTKLEGGWMAKVGTKVKYAPYVEYGTGSMQKEPFMSTGLDHSRDDIQRLAEFEWAQVMV